MATGKDYIDLNNVFRLIQGSEMGTFRYGDLLVEVGSANYAASGAATDSTDVAVYTQLNEIVAGFAMPFDSYSPATDVSVEYILSVAPDITEDTNSHRKTFSVYRSSHTPIAGLKFAYLVFGRHFATD